MDRSQADGVLVGRGIYGKPWFINQVGHYLATGETLPDPDLETQRDCVLEHYQSMLEFYGDHGVKIARKHIGWYSKGYYGATEFRAAINRELDPEKVKALIHGFYDPMIERMTRLQSEDQHERLIDRTAA
jgi:tRNA-dihydrouridine synthase B